MGRIKSLMIKKAAKQLLVGENRFTESFEDDKKILGSTMPSKPVRNKIAGYIARLKKMEKVKNSAAPQKVVPVSSQEQIQ